MMKKGLISSIQRYSTKDGPGLRTTVFLMGCNLRCAWCANPENLVMKPRVFYFKERCKQCGLCVKHAENQSITLADVGVSIDRKKCTNITDMIDLCPYDAYEQIGMEMTPEELAKKLLRDQEFYHVGAGGVTFSGGEATVQAEFIYETAKILKEAGIHVCLDTAGLVREETLVHLLENIDMVLYDIKAIDDNMHKSCTGVSNKKILRNAEIIVENNVDLKVRLVIIPDYNDDFEDMKKRIDFICTLGSSVKEVNILEYHKYGVGKYDKLGEEYPIKENLVMKESIIDKLLVYGKSKNLKISIGG